MATRVVNRRNKGARYDVYVGRPSEWGNPYGYEEGTLARFKTRTREIAVRKYEQWVRNQPTLVARIRRELGGKTLGCWCIDDDGRLPKPVVCHAQVLARIADEAVPIASRAPAHHSYDPKAHGALCDECPLQGRHVPVPPTSARGGVANTKLIIIGEGPGRMEIAIGKGFVGPSGQFLDKLLGRSDFDRSDAHITNGALCMGDSDTEKVRAGACCAPRLASELADLPLGAPVLALGAAAQQIFTGKRSIMRTRGFIWRLAEVEPSRVRAAERNLEKKRGMDPKKYGPAIDRAEQSFWRIQARAKLAGRVVIPSIHPAFVLRGGEGAMPMLRVDIRRAARAAKGELCIVEPGEFRVATTAAELKRELKRLRTKEIVIDVETLGPSAFVDEMTMFGVSEVPDIAAEGLVAEAARKYGKVASDDLRVVLASPPAGETRASRARAQKALHEMGAVLNAFVQKRTVVGHNIASFDKPVLRRYGVELKKIEDTLIGHHAYASHLRQGLDHVASMYLDITPWKIDFKQRGAEEKGGMAPSRFAQSDALNAYNAQDVKSNAIVWRRMQPDLDGERQVYAADMQLAEVCLGMATAGFRFDEKLADQLSGQLKYRAGALLGQMRTLIGRSDFHPARPSELRSALFGQLRASPIAITGTGLASTASGTLETLKGMETKAGALADLILRWRACHKTRSTFIDRVVPLSDGRIHPSWKPFGTVTGRLSCRAPNLQNLPRWSRALEDRVRELYVAAPGCELIYFDLSQSEMRMAAYLSGDEAFIASCETGDVHTSNAKILFPYAREKLDRDPKGKHCPRHSETGSDKAACNCGKPFRDVAKNAGFGILYQADTETIFKFLLSKGFDVSLPDVEAMFLEIHRVYARYYAYCDENMAFCKTRGHLREEFSTRIRWLGWYPAITDVSNYKVQGGIAGLMNKRIVPLVRRLPRGARIVAQVHDSCIIEARKGAAARQTGGLIREVWDEPIVTPTNGKVWKMPIDLKTGGERWSDFG